MKENLRDLTITEIRELISILLKHDFTSIHSPINLASVSLLLNKMLSPALSHQIDLEDYSNICSVLSVLCQLQRNDDVISTVDPKTVRSSPKVAVKIHFYPHP